MHEQLTVFQRALTESILKEYADVPQEKDLPDVFSADFQNWIAGFRKKSKLRVATVVKRILIAAIIAVLLASAAMAIPAVREKVIAFFFHKDDTKIGITFDPEQAATAPTFIEKGYTISYIPDTYTLMTEVNDISGICLLWMDNNGQTILYIQNTVQARPENGNWLGFDATNVSRRTVLMGDYLVEVLEYEEKRILVWTNNEYLFTIELPNSIAEAQWHKIFASWVPIE